MLEKQNVVTIKKIKLWSLKKVFQICDDNFFFEILYKFKNI